MSSFLFRYIEVFRSSKSDIKHVIGQRSNRDFVRPLMNQRPGPYDRPSYGQGRRGRGGPNLGPSGFNNGGGGGYDGGYDGGRMSRGRGGPMRGGRGGRMGGGGGGHMGGGSGAMQQSSKTGYCVHMRGLPFDSTTNDVIKFFAPLNPVDIRFLYDHTGRSKGECDVDFSSPNDAEGAMGKDKQNIGHRYIELFLKSNTGLPGGNTGGGGGGWSNNDMGGGGEMAPLMNPNANQPPPLGGSQQQQYGGSNSYSSYGGGYTSSQQQQQPSYATDNSYSTQQQQQPIGGGYSYSSQGGVGTGNMSYSGVQQGSGQGNNYYGSMR